MSKMLLFSDKTKTETKMFLVGKKGKKHDQLESSIKGKTWVKNVLRFPPYFIKP